MFVSTISDEKFKWALVQLISELVKDREVMLAIEELVIEILSRPQIIDATNSLLLNSTKEVLVNTQVSLIH